MRGRQRRRLRMRSVKPHRKRHACSAEHPVPHSTISGHFHFFCFSRLSKRWKTVLPVDCHLKLSRVPSVFDVKVEISQQHVGPLASLRIRATTLSTAPADYSCPCTSCAVMATTAIDAVAIAQKYHAKTRQRLSCAWAGL